MASRILKELHESAKGLRNAGAMDITTMREFDALCLPPVKKMSAHQIKVIRAKYKVSQPVFAAYLNLSPSTVRQWENGDKAPSGPSLKLLNIVREKGLAALA